MNKYNRLRQIGEGAFGRAVLVKQKDTAKQFVIKEINITKMSTKEREQARKEVAVLAQLKHPNIVAYVESFEERGSLYIVMNYCSGGDLYGRINERRGQLFSEDQILDWFVQLCLAVKHIHDRKILHRDIKCQNIFLTQTGTVQLGDFGIAKVLTSTAQLAHTCIGTPYYLSPEIVENMPYNNKSDIWSIGCVLYEVTMLKHAFEAQNMKNLVLKIIRASYPPISPQFSYDLRGLIAQLFKRNPRDRPSVNSILRKNFIMQRVRRLLPAQDLADEFSHTIMHGHKIAKALPPAPKPSAEPVKMAAPVTPRPGSAARKYDPAAVYGVPLNSSKNRMSGEKKRPSTPGRQLPIPGQAEWEKKKKDRIEFEQKRRAEMKRREQDMNERRLKDHVEKQKVARINKAREEGWRNLVSPAAGDEGNRTPTPNNNQQYSPRPLPVPKANKNNRDRGNYDAYNEYLQKMYKNKQTPPPDPRQLGNPNHVDVINMAAPRLQPAAGPQPWSPVAGPQPWAPAPNQQFNMGPLGVAVPAAMDQAGRDRYSYNMQLGAQAAQRARVVEDYIQRQRQAALNKMRAQHDLFGVYRPPSADRRTPVPAPGRGSSPKNQGGNGGGGLVARNNEEQEYLDKLRQIRIQNMRDRRDMPRAANAAEDVSRGKKSPNAEERRKKVEALKAQAEHWVEMKKNELQQQRLGIVPHGQSQTPVPMTDALQAIGAVEKARQSPSLKNEKPSPVPLTNALQIIAGAPSSKEESTAESERPKSALQKQRDNVLKKLNKKQNPLRRKWGAPSSPAIQASEEVGRAKWGSPASPSINIVEGQGSEVSRAQWRGGKDLHLSKITLEATASGMEATNPGDGVINMAAECQLREMSALPAKGEQNVRKSQWGRGTEVLKLLDQMTISEDIGTESSQSEPRVPPVGVGSTIVLSSQKPPAQGRTITISCDDGGKAAADMKTQMKTVQDLPPGRPGTVVLSREYTAGKNLPVVDDTDSSQKIEAGPWKEASVKVDMWRTINEDVRDGTTSVQMNLTKGHFDLKNIELLRTCSEPDLTQLSRTMVPEPGKLADDKAASAAHSTLRRHHSLDLTTGNEDDSEDSDDEGDFSEEEIVIAYDNDDNDDKEGEMDADIEEDDEEDDIKSMRETMMSILEDGNIDVSEKDKTLNNQQQSPDESSSDNKISSIKTIPQQKDDDNPDEVDEPAGNPLDTDAVWNEVSSRDGHDEVLENNDLALTLDLENDDSDNETTFGDDSDDNDRFGRLEELRKHLELELGMEKLLEVYQTVQKLQEDEEGNIEDDAKLALQLLGSEKQHLFPKIFQLVMSDIAFTEG